MTVLICEQLPDSKLIYVRISNRIVSAPLLKGKTFLIKRLENRAHYLQELLHFRLFLPIHQLIEVREQFQHIECNISSYSSSEIAHFI